MPLMFILVVLFQVALLSVAGSTQVTHEWLLSVMLAQVISKVRDFGKLLVAPFETAVEERPVLPSHRVENFYYFVPLGRHTLKIVSILRKFIFIVDFDFYNQMILLTNFWLWHLVLFFFDNFGLEGPWLTNLDLSCAWRPH